MRKFDEYETKKIINLFLKISLTKKSELVHQLHDRVNRIKQDKRLEVEYMTLLEIKERELQKGIKIGIEQGIEQGKEEEKVEIAQNLLDVLDDETIALKTGLTIEEVRRIRDEN